MSWKKLLPEKRTRWVKTMMDWLGEVDAREYRVVDAETRTIVLDKTRELMVLAYEEFDVDKDNAQAYGVGVYHLVSSVWYPRERIIDQGEWRYLSAGFLLPDTLATCMCKVVMYYWKQDKFKFF